MNKMIDNVKVNINRMKNAMKIIMKYFLPMMAKYTVKHKAIGYAIAAGTVVAAAYFPPAIPAVLVVGGAASYINYKKDNPKGTISHFAKSASKQIRNRSLRRMESTNIGQLIMRTKKRIKENENEKISKANEVLIEITDTLINGTEGKKNIYSENAEKSARLTRARMLKIRNENKNR